jgi:hypothetical protein
MNKNIIFVIVAVVIAGASFYGGMLYQQSQRRNNFTQFAGGPNGSARGGNGQSQGIRPVNGQIISADSQSITVKLRDGSSRIVILSDKTSINKSAPAAKEDLKVGEDVAVFGTQNSDNSVTAQSISLNPMNPVTATGSGR